MHVVWGVVSLVLGVDEQGVLVFVCVNYMLVAFSSHARILGRMLDHSFPACAFILFFEMEISSRALIPLVFPGLVHGGSANGEDVAEC